MAAVHKHLIIRAEIKNPPRDRNWTHEWLVGLVEKIDMKICMGPIVSYIDVPGNRGMTGVVIIETSHIALHTWDEDSPGLLQLDVYTCGPFDPNVIFEEIKVFEPVKVEYKYLDRERNLVEVDLQSK